jgi:hypothetical protein
MNKLQLMRWIPSAVICHGSTRSLKVSVSTSLASINTQSVVFKYTTENLIEFHLASQRVMNSS